MLGVSATFPRALRHSIGDSRAFAPITRRAAEKNARKDKNPSDRPRGLERELATDEPLV